MNNYLKRLILWALFLSVVGFSPLAYSQQLPLQPAEGDFAAPALSSARTSGEKSKSADGKLGFLERLDKAGRARPEYEVS